MLRTAACIAVCFIASASGPRVAAQPVEANAPCSYAECAIRIESRFFAGQTILRGAPGADENLGSVGLLGGGLSDAVAEVPQALDYAQTSGRYRIGALVAVAAGTVALAASVADLYSTDSNRYQGFYYAGLGLSLAGGVLGLKSQQAQSRAVWEYNRAVAGE